MQPVTLIFLAAVVAVALADGQYYVPRSYYVIDAEGHASVPVPLRRLRRAIRPGTWGPGGSSATADSRANSFGGGSAHSIAIANAYPYGGGGNYGPPIDNGPSGGGGGGGGWGLPSPMGYGATLGSGQTRRQSGLTSGGRSVVASSSVGMDSSGQGYYDQYTSVD